MGSTTPSAGEPLAHELMARLGALPMARWHYGMIGLAGAALIFDTADQGLASAAQVGIAAEFGVKQAELGLLISAAFLGATVSAAVIGFLADRFGRRRIIALSILVFSLATSAAALSQDLTQLLVFRVIAGVGYGGLFPMVWAFGSEFAPVRARGKTLSWLNAFYGAGTALAYLIGLAVIVPLGWRWGFAVFLIPAVLAYFVVRNLPEGIPYLIRRGRLDEARGEVERIEARVLRGRPQPAFVLDADQADGAGVSIVSAAKQLFSRRHVLQTLTVVVGWPIPALFVIGTLGFYPLIFTRDLGMPLPLVLAFLTVSAFLTVVGRIIAGFILDPIRRLSSSGLKFFFAGGVFFFGAVPFVVLSAHWTATQILLLLCAQYLLQGLWAGAGMTYTPNVMPVAIRNAGLGLFSALTNLAQIVGPVLVGLLLQFAGLQTAINLTLGVSIVCAVFVAVFGHRERIASLPAAPQASDAPTADAAGADALKP